MKDIHLGTEKLVKSNEKITFSCFFIIFAKKFCDMGKDLTIEELVFDDKNFNKHTEQGMTLLEKSLQELGAGRSILVDKNNNIISGNGIAEAAGRVGIKKVRVIEVQGDELVAVRRTDMELDSEKGRKMALADNATAAVDLSWDYDTLQTVADEFDIDTEEWGVIPQTIIDPDDFFDALNNENESKKDKIVIVIPSEISDEKENIKNDVLQVTKKYAGLVVK